MASEHVVEVGDHNFEQEVLSAELPTVVDFYGPMCGPCKALEPILDRLAVQHEGRLKFAKVNVDHCPQTTLRYAISSLPTVVLIKEGKVLSQFNSAPTPRALEEFISKAL